jgi:hypothetical protein
MKRQSYKKLHQINRHKYKTFRNGSNFPTPFLRVAKIAAQHANGRLQICAQPNHPSLKVAIQLAKANIAAGPDVISLAVLVFLAYLKHPSKHISLNLLMPSQTLYSCKILILVLLR